MAIREWAAIREWVGGRECAAISEGVWRGMCKGWDDSSGL
jgi:hypothetical protein